MGFTNQVKKLAFYSKLLRKLAEGRTPQWLCVLQSTEASVERGGSKWERGASEEAAGGPR